MGILAIFLFSCGGGGGIDRERDTDGDGMPDWWEITYGLDPDNPNDAAQDPDRDGWTSFEEYRNGTDPRIADPPKELCNGQDDDGDTLIDEVWLENGLPCGMCGISRCSADGLSLECQGQGECFPGDNKYCGSNGMKTCLDTCQWNECLEALQCAAGEEENSQCGYCQEGLQTRTCGYNGLWSVWSDCLGRGCEPSAMEDCQAEGKPGTRECSDECQWGDCVADCNPGDKFVASCGDCGGMQTRTCLSDGSWGGWGRCQCEDQTQSRDFPGYDTQTRTCGEESWCSWTPWTNCTLEGAECESGALETRACGCGATGLEIRTCSEFCVWGEWSDCQNDSDLTPPSVPEPLTPADGSAFHALPITFSWTASSDNCGLSAPGAYQISLLNMSDPYANPITVTTDSNFYEMNSSFFLVRNYRWWVQAKDAAGNYSEPSLAREFTFYPEEISHETFDSPSFVWSWGRGDDDPGSDNDYWGRSDAQPHFGMYSAWCAAAGTQGNDECGAAGADNLSVKKYDNDMKAFLEMVFYPGGHSHVILSFWYWLEIADTDDCLKVRAKDQAGAWSDLWQICRQSNGWATNDYVDLSSFSGQDKITIQFLFESDGSGHCAAGAYLDDIVVEGW